MGWPEIASLLGGVNLAVVVRIAFQSGALVQQIKDIDKRLARVEAKQ